jgi:hypothetical protein
VTPTRKAFARALLTLAVVLVASAGCTRHTGPNGGSTPPQGAAGSASEGTPATVPDGGGGPGTTTVSTREAYPWRYPNTEGPGNVRHDYPVPPVPQLVKIAVGDHPRDPGQRPFNRMSFTFTTAFPTYTFQYVLHLTGDANAKPVTLEGQTVLRIFFKQAQAHTVDGTSSSITGRPPQHLGLSRMVSYAQAGDFEAVITYGIGVNFPPGQVNAQLPVRVVEVESVDAQGVHHYTVAFDVDAS